MHSQLLMQLSFQIIDTTFELMEDMSPLPQRATSRFVKTSLL